MLKISSTALALLAIVGLTAQHNNAFVEARIRGVHKTRNVSPTRRLMKSVGGSDEAAGGEGSLLNAEEATVDLSIVGNNGEFDSYPLKICEGECDTDEDCEGDLICYQREAYESVPGCTDGGPGFATRGDFCIPADQGKDEDKKADEAAGKEEEGKENAAKDEEKKDEEEKNEEEEAKAEDEKDDDKKDEVDMELMETMSPTDEDSMDPTEGDDEELIDEPIMAAEAAQAGKDDEDDGDADGPGGKEDEDDGDADGPGGKDDEDDQGPDDDGDDKDNKDKDNEDADADADEDEDEDKDNKNQDDKDMDEDDGEEDKDDNKDDKGGAAADDGDADADADDGDDGDAEPAKDKNEDGDDGDDGDNDGDGGDNTPSDGELALAPVDSDGGPMGDVDGDMESEAVVEDDIVVDDTDEDIMPLEVVGQDGQPTQVFPLGRCQGECDSNDDCQPGLVCFQRSAGTEVPGCRGRLNSDTDFCILSEDFEMLATEVPETDALDAAGMMTDAPTM